MHERCVKITKSASLLASSETGMSPLAGEVWCDFIVRFQVVGSRKVMWFRDDRKQEM